MLTKEIFYLTEQDFLREQKSCRLNLPYGKIKSESNIYIKQPGGPYWQNELNAVFLSANQLYCRWHIHPFFLKGVFMCEKPLNPAFLDLRIFDITNIYFNGVNAHSVTCIKVSKEDHYWVIKGLKRDRSYICEIGFLMSDYLFFPLLRSHPVHTPYEHSGDYIHKMQMAEQFYHSQFRLPPWIEHPDCR